MFDLKAISTTDLVAVVALVVNVAVWLVYWRTLQAIREQCVVASNASKLALNSSFLQLFPIVERHHSKEVGEYRVFARETLPRICNEARAKAQSVKEYAPEHANTIAKIANYYESIGMLVEHGAKNLLPDVKAVLIDMVQVSAYDIWEIYYEHMDVIHPQPLGKTWAGSFENLYYEIASRNSWQTLPRINRSAQPKHSPRSVDSSIENDAWLAG